MTYHTFKNLNLTRAERFTVKLFLGFTSYGVLVALLTRLTTC